MTRYEDLTLSRECSEALVWVILSTVSFDSGRGGHTVETLIHAIYEMGALQIANAKGVDAIVRQHVAAMLASGHLDMRANGVLILPREIPTCEAIEYKGRWYSVVTEPPHIGGPFLTQREAAHDVTQYSGSKEAESLHGSPCDIRNRGNYETAK